MTEIRPVFGCLTCWPDTPEEALVARRVLVLDAVLIERPHYTVRVLACSVCQQRFVTVFTEIIDWKARDDTQYWTMLPLRPEELDMLRWRGENVTAAALNMLGGFRRSLCRDWVTGEKPRTYFGRGIYVGRHD